MKEKTKEIFRKFRKWIIVQKYTLGRGYSNTQQVMIGVIFASSIKIWLPNYFDTAWKFIALVLISMIILYLIGWIDRKFKFIHTEQKFVTEMNPIMMDIKNKVTKKRKK